MTRPHGSAKADRRSPKPWAVCDRCGFLYNKRDLQWQYEWIGPRTQNTNMLVCGRCLDDLQEQQRTIKLPADPVPINNPRPQANTLDNPITSLGGVIGNMTQAAGLAAAFDSNINKPMFMSACRYVSTNGAFNSIGKSWLNMTTGNVGFTATSFTAYAPNDAKLFGGGSTTYAFQGSNDNIIWTTIQTGSTVGGTAETLTVTLSPTTSYLYHQLLLTGDGVNSVSVAQLQISCAGIG